MSSVEVHVEGLDRLEKALLGLPDAVCKKALRQAVKAGADIFLTDMRMRARVRTGKMVHDLKARVSVRATKGSVSADIGARDDRKKGGHAYLARFQEFGTKPHVIRARKGKALLVPGGGFVYQVSHPGQPARPFIRPAFDSRKDQVVDVLGKTLGDFIERYRPVG